MIKPRPPYLAGIQFYPHTSRPGQGIDQTYPNAPHAVCELLVHAEVISLADSLAGWGLVQDLVLGTAEGVSQPCHILFRHPQALLDLTVTQLLICEQA